jgi:hypothetical protein
MVFITPSFVYGIVFANFTEKSFANSSANLLLLLVVRIEKDLNFAEENNKNTVLLCSIFTTISTLKSLF